MMEAYSVLMSVYCKEQAAHFQAAIDSMLHQTVPPVDFVIVCDGPLTPELDNVIADYCEAYPSLFQILRLEKNQGLGPALKIGLDACQCEYVARMDTDDISLPDRMEKQLAALRQSPHVSAVGGQIAEFDNSPDNIVDYRIVPESYEEIQSRAAKRNPMNHVTVVFKKSQVQKVGSYCDIPGFEDYHLWVQMLAAGQQLINIGDVCCYVRVDTHMYGRRGGWTYFKYTVEMERFLMKTGFINAPGFLRNVMVRFFGTVVCPNSLRSFLFQKCMRQKQL